MQQYQNLQIDSMSDDNSDSDSENTKFSSLIAHRFYEEKQENMLKQCFIRWKQISENIDAKKKGQDFCRYRLLGKGFDGILEYAIQSNKFKNMLIGFYSKYLKRRAFQNIEQEKYLNQRKQSITKAVKALQFVFQTISMREKQMKKVLFEKMQKTREEKQKYLQNQRKSYIIAGRSTQKQPRGSQQKLNSKEKQQNIEQRQQLQMGRTDFNYLPTKSRMNQSRFSSASFFSNKQRPRRKYTPITEQINLPLPSSLQPPHNPISTTQKNQVKQEEEQYQKIHSNINNQKDKQTKNAIQLIIKCKLMELEILSNLKEEQNSILAPYKSENINFLKMLLRE